MNTKQLIVVIGGVILFSGLIIFGKTTSSKPKETPISNANTKPSSAINTKDLLTNIKQKLTEKQLESIQKLEKDIDNQSSNEDKIHLYHQLAKYWKDSVNYFEPYAIYTAEAAKLDNSEKSLTFAAHLFIQSLLNEPEPSMQNWLATNGKVLLEKANEINPNNDSTKVGLGACYILGNVSDNPMQGLQLVREVEKKNPNNMFAQWVLALGGKRSGQFDKAIERFTIILKNNSKSLPAMLHLAECYELKGDNANAIIWYKKVQSIFDNDEARKELQAKIEELSKK